MGAALLALGASLTWGVGDFLGGLKARVLPALIVLALSQPFGLAALGLAVAVRGTGIPGDGGAWSALAAVFGTVGLFAFYRGMAAGAISVVTPIAAVAAGIPVIWGVVVSGDPISAFQAIGFVAAGGSVREPRSRYGRSGTACGRGRLGGARDACLRCLHVPMHAASTQDWLLAFLFRCTSATLVWTVVLIRRMRPSGLRPHWPGLVAVGLLDTAGNALFAAASSHHGLLSVAAVLASLYPVVTVLLARIVLGERVQRTQDVGVVLALTGVVLITAGG